MRWPFRKRGTESAVDGESPAVERPRAREWTALPPLPGTFDAKAPLVTGPAPVLPPLPGRHEPMPASDPTLRGTVQGIASVVRPVRFDHTAADVVHRPTPRRAVVRPEAPAEPEPLTYVDEQHVEEPREPKAPHRAPAWLRYTPPAWMTQQQGDEPGVPGLPLPIMETPAPAPLPPFPVVKAKAERRMNLGQTRRLGLGAPISLGEQPLGEQQSAAREENPAPEEPAPALVHPDPAQPVVRPEPTPAVVRQEPTPALVHQEPAPPTAPVPATPTPPLIHESVPTELATAMRQTHGVDVADVPVVRGPVVSAQARSLGARAFTRAGKVHLPDEAGPLASPRARGLVAHELVHAVQQRTLGLSLPSPSSEHGQALEAEAVAVERFYAGETSAPEPPPLIHAPRVAPVVQSFDTHAQLAATTTPAVTPPQQAQPQQSAIDSRVREEVDRVATATARRVVEQEWQNPSLTTQQRQALGLPAQQEQQQDQPDPTAGYLEAAVLSRLRPSRTRHAPPDSQHTNQPQQGPLSQTTATTVQAQSTQGAATPGTQQQQDQSADPTAGYLEAQVLGRLTHHGHHLHRDTAQQQQSPTPQQQPSQPQSQALTQHPATTASTTGATVHDTAATGAAAHHHVDISELDLEELSARLYARLRSRLRLELLVDRERAGLLTDYR